jgi:hypothetical protein
MLSLRPRKAKEYFEQSDDKPGSRPPAHGEEGLGSFAALAAPAGKKSFFACF